MKAADKELISELMENCNNIKDGNFNALEVKEVNILPEDYEKP